MSEKVNTSMERTRILDVQREPWWCTAGRRQKLYSLVTREVQDALEFLVRLFDYT